MSIKAHELPFVREMFDHIAPRYDFLNRLLSMRQDTLWRRTLVRALHLSPEARVLDTACGTGDVMLEILRQAGRNTQVVGLDFSPAMLRLAHPKCLPAMPPGGRTALVAADVFDLPFAENRFDAITMAFGIRNIQNKPAVLERFLRHLKPGGRLAILELVTPSGGILRAIYLSYFIKLLPLIGRFFSRHRYAYSYLPESVTHFPQPSVFARTMRRAGFVNVRYRRLTFGICALFVGDKPIE
jgi:demethylmenaquinone methyltransferase/2-methoxy-6-polyprenyl-1,4-benzoquinol methylase